MTCRCGCDFCFVCLKEKKSNKWECTPYDFSCPIAPRQTKIPGSQPVEPCQSALPFNEEVIVRDQTASIRAEETVFEREQVVTLKTCVTTTVGDVHGCPVIRSCPRCGTLLRHEGERKHMVCKCGCNFCFVCLKEDQIQSQDLDGSVHDFNCFLAPRQTAIRSPVSSVPKPTTVRHRQRCTTVHSIERAQPTTPTKYHPKTTKSESPCVIC